MEHVYKLADPLLKDIEPFDGKAWVDSRTAHGGVPNPQLKAREVLDHWYNHSPETPYGGKLYAVLRKILPRVAADFQENLL